MSDNSYNVVDLHPEGGFYIRNLSASASEEYDAEKLKPRPGDTVYATGAEASDAAYSDYCEYGVQWTDAARAARRLERREKIARAIHTADWTSRNFPHRDAWDDMGVGPTQHYTNLAEATLKAMEE